MNRVEFMDRLSELLGDVSEAEREEALKYYRDYFEDAGSWNEQNVISELVSPEKVAETIKESLAGETSCEYAEESSVEMPVEVIDNTEKTQSYSYGTSEEVESGSNSDKTSTDKKSKGISTGVVIAIAVACVLLSPVILSGIGSILSFIATVLLVWLVISILIAVGPFALTAGGIAAIVAGIIKFMSDAAIGALMVGSGLIGIGVSLIGYVILWLYFFKLMPMLFRWIFRIGKKGGKK